MTPEEIAAKAAADAAAAETAAAEAAAATATAEAAAAKELEEAEAAAAAALDAGKDSVALAAEKAKLLREVMEKKTKLKEAEKKATDAAAALAAYEGVDPAKVKELLKKEKDAETTAAEARGDFDRVKSMMAEEHTKEKKSLEDRIKDLEGALSGKDEAINTLTIGNDFGSSTYIKEHLTLTPAKSRQLYGSHFETEDGRSVGYDKPKGAANRTKLVNASGDPLPFDEAFKRIIDADPDKETLLKAKVVPGSGSNSNQTKTVEKKTAAGLSGVDRIRASFGK
jgi:hypothetical protein